MTRRVVLLTGGTGTLGSLAATALLRRGDVEVVAPVRSHHAPDAVATAVRRELELAGGPVGPDWRDRLHQVVLPVDADNLAAVDSLGELDDVVDRFDVDEVVHCAGCLDYFDQAMLRAVNIVMTRRFVEASRRWGLRRFVHVSTAFSSGFCDGVIPERLHDRPPAGDPTFYTESKRLGEKIVAESGVPFLILRPSIVIGDSRDGHYAGPRYGLYQLWSAAERFLLANRHTEVHLVAPQQTIPLLHQDAFQSSFVAAWSELPDGTICHLTSRGGPTSRDVAEMFANRYLESSSVRYHERLADVELESISPGQRAFLRMAAVNIEISSRPWRFETGTLDNLAAGGASFADATIETVQRCQDAYFVGRVTDRASEARSTLTGTVRRSPAAS